MKRSDLLQPAISQRIMARTAADGDCRIWQGSTQNSGYGVTSWGGERWLVHRAMWTSLRGPIPDGLTIDHLCRKRLCVVVQHMETVTAAVNANRGGGLQVAHERARSRTHCKRNHEFTPENTEIDNKGHRQCRTCRRAGWSRWYTASGRRSPRQLKPCPSRAAYYRHLAAGEDCPACREANANSERSRRATTS